MRLDEFEEDILSASLSSPVVASVTVSGTGITWLRLRIILVNGAFIETFYNELTGRIAFALIQDQRRIFGADNTGGWHWHPFDSPDSHIPSAEAISFDTFLERVADNLQK